MASRLRRIFWFKKDKPASKSCKKNRRRDALVSEECVVCLDTRPCLTTSTCNHPICVSCLGVYITVTHNSRLPCPCPSSAICQSEFTIDDIAPFVNDETIAKIWLMEATKLVEKGLGMYCPNQKCSKPIYWKEKVARRKVASGKCKNCSQPICISCKAAYHSNLTYMPFPLFSYRFVSCLDFVVWV